MRKKKAIEFDNFLTHIMYQSGVGKERIKSVFTAWLRHFVISLKKNHSAEIPYIGRLKLNIGYSDFVTKDGKKERRKCYYLRFMSNGSFKEYLASTDKADNLMDELIDQIEEDYKNNMK